MNPEANREEMLIGHDWHGLRGLAADVRYYGRKVQQMVEKRIGHLYPAVAVTADMGRERADLRPLVGTKLNVLAYLWARTVKSPNPAFSNVAVPLATTFFLSRKTGKEVYVEPKVAGKAYRFLAVTGRPKDESQIASGTKQARANFTCLMSGSPISGDYIMAEGKAGRIGTRMIAMMAERPNGRVYLSPSDDVEQIASNATSEWKPDVEFFQQALGFRVGNYGMSNWSDLFTARQLTALTNLSDAIREIRQTIIQDALVAGVASDNARLDEGGTGAQGYADAVCVYLSCALSRCASYNNSFCTWNMNGGSVAQIFGRQAIPMSWDFIEINPLAKMSGNWDGGVEWVSDVLEKLYSHTDGLAMQLDAASGTAADFIPTPPVISTDPPYYDNIGYADLSDFFYVWLRSTLRDVFPNLFATMVTPKAQELVATPARHGGKQGAEAFFLDGMTDVMEQLARRAHPAFPVTIYYAFKQSENDSENGVSSTGWETFLNAVIAAGFSVTGTWPIRTERDSRLRGQQSNALATSVVLVCRKRPENVKAITRREFVNLLRDELPTAVAYLQRGNVAPVDLAQAAIGPGMAVFTRFAQVLDAGGKPLSVQEALSLINQRLDEILAEQEGDFDADTRWALAWFEQAGFNEGEYGVAETLSKAKNTSVGGMVEAGILSSSRGKVRLLRPEQLPLRWDPATDLRLTAWESVHHLVRALEEGGEGAAAELVAKLGSRAETARELAYRLYNLCERKKRAAEALSYNALVQSWPEIMRLAETAIPRQERLI